MVTIVDYAKRTNSDGENFFALIVESGLEAVKSQETGKTYFTKKKASVPSTFTEEECQSLIGEQMDGSVKRVSCNPYEITDESTGEVIRSLIDGSTSWTENPLKRLPGMKRCSSLLMQRNLKLSFSRVFSESFMWGSQIWLPFFYSL